MSSSNTLPNHTSPSMYDILFIFGDNDKYIGVEKINIKVNESTAQIILNSRDQNITNCNLRKKNNNILIPKITINKKREFLILDFETNLETTEYELLIWFDGSLSEIMDGVYKSKNNNDFVILTHFEPSLARSAFPCWDEPNYKATFKTQFIVESDLVVLSNTDVKFEKEIPLPRTNIKLFNKTKKYKYIEFNPSPTMSTYTVAWVIGRMECLETHTENSNIKIRIWTAPKQSHQAKLALKISSDTMDYLEKIFGTKYEISKIDLVSVEDFLAGAMENWGLIIFRSSMLLTDEYAAYSDFESIVVTVCHELVHQWFGNLVTMKWWNDLWLSETMATFFSYYIIDKLYPKMNIWNSFYFQRKFSTLDLDSLKSTHAIAIGSDSIASLQDIFDGVTYDKGSTMMKMFADYVGEYKFLSIIQTYLSKYAHLNTTSSDFLAIVNEHADSNILKSWLTQKGYPLITINNKTNTISQYRFQNLLNKDDITKELWYIPLFSNDANKKPEILATTDSTIDNIEFDLIHNGFYTIKYENQNELEHVLKSTLKMKSEVEKIHILRDMIILGLNKYYDIKIVFKLINYFLPSNNVCIWKLQGFD